MRAARRAGVVRRRAARARADGDLIELDVAARKLELKVPDDGARAPARGVEEAAAALRARVRRALPAARHAGGPGLRFRLPRRHGADARSRKSTDAQRIAASKLVDLVAAIMQGGGSHTEEARTIARRLVDSNLVGHDSHGVLRVGKYLEWVREGWLKPNTPPTIVFDSDTHRDRRRQSRLRPGDRRIRDQARHREGGAEGHRARSACATAGISAGWATGPKWRPTPARSRCIFSTRRARSASRRSAAATGACRPIRWRSACRSPEAIRRSSTSRPRPWPKAS